MNTSDIPNYTKFGFSNEKYLKTQTEKILERIDKFKQGKLYLEIGGKFLYDPHAARVLPGLDPEVKKDIFKSLRNISDLIYCVNAKDIISNRQLKNSEEKYADVSIQMMKMFEDELSMKPIISLNLLDHEISDEIDEYIRKVESLGYRIYKRYKIDGYPENVDHILSQEGYGADQYIETNRNLVLVTGAASNSGKMSTCLGQIYQDKLSGKVSGYAKYETFPIWSLPINHPVNLAYEAATADIGDYNVIDSYHESAYGKRSVNYNRDVDAFEIIMRMSKHLLSSQNPMTSYKSPTDMGINYAGFAITNDEIVCIASLEEIRRRASWYQEVIDRGEGDPGWVKKCMSLENQAVKYISERGYKSS
jgi:uncharacterized protein (UPF0371 family)